MSRYVDAHGAVDPQFARLMVMLYEAYPAMRLREGTTRVYAQQLGDLSLAEVEAAMGAAIRESEFLPTVAAIRRQAQPATEEAGILAWAGLLRAAAVVGGWASLDVEDQATAEAVERVFGGWPAVCRLEEGPALAQARQAFLAAYRDARRTARGRPQGRARRLSGACEAERLGGAMAGVIGLLEATGEVRLVSERLALTEGTDGDRRTALAEAGTAGTDEGASEAGGGGRGPDGPAAGGGS